MSVTPIGFINDDVIEYYERLKKLKTKKEKLSLLQELYNIAYRQGLWDN